MLGAGTIINPILKVVTTVAILAAAYIFIVKPILDTTNTAFESFSDSFNGFDDLPGQIQTQVGEAFDSTDDSKALQRCIKRAIGETPPDQRRVERCIERLS